MEEDQSPRPTYNHTAWNKGKLMGAKPPVCFSAVTRHCPSASACRVRAITGPEQSQQKSPLLDHLVGADKQAGEKCS